MQATIHLDDNLMQTAFQLSGIKTEQALIEQAVKELIKSYQTATSAEKSWLGCMRNEGKIIGDIMSPVMNENEWEVLSQ
ncbi:MAG: Bacterial antitoxin of type system, VapB [Pseudomonadota bacterium]|jgi:Arc/MetJ family transcription regulator